MRYLVGLVSVLAGLGTLPQSASAQAGEEHSLSFWHDEALKIALFSAPPSTSEAYTLELEEMERRVKRATNGLIAFASLLAVGAIVMGSAAWAPATCNFEEPCAFFNRMLAGGALMGIGAIGMIISGVRLARRKRDRDWLRRQAHYATPRRVEWDLALSRVVF
jgi:hypothetical protein